MLECNQPNPREPYQNPNDSPDLLGELTEEFVQRFRAGERPDWQEYAGLHPELAEQIRELFPTMMLMEQSRNWQLQLDELERGPVVRDSMGAKLERLGDFQLIREVGRGGMGIVFEAFQESLGRRVALKILSPALMMHPLHLERFQVEARAVAQLHHTHIVPLYGVGEMQGVHYYVMPLVDGWGLDRLLDDLRATQPSPVSSASYLFPELVQAYRLHRRDYFQRVVQICAQVTEALAYSHGEGILHRDIKPSNILLDMHGDAWLTDFGMAKSQDSEDLTRSNDLIGTLRYMPPERLRGVSDARSDIYSFGLVLYELATLSPAFSMDEKASLLEQITVYEPLQPTKHDKSIPNDLETIILKCIQKEPAARYATADDLLQDLKLFLADMPIRARPIHRLAKAWRWCRRNPALAGLELALAVTLMLAFGAITWKWRDAEVARSSESAARSHADVVATQWKQSLDDLRDANKLLEVARKGIQEKRWDDAALAYYRATQKCPDNAAIWQEQAEVAAHWGLYDIARKGFTEVFRCQEPETSSVWYRLALLQMYLGDEAGYRETIERMKARFAGTTNQVSVRELVRSQLLDSRPGDDTKAFVDRMVAVNGWETGVWSNQYLCGIAHLRDGQTNQAAQWLQDSLDGSTVIEARKIGYPILAMAQFKNGDATAARSTLLLAKESLDKWIEARCQSRQGWLVHWNFFAEMPIVWLDWLEFNVYYREACLLIDGSSPPDDPRLKLILARTYAGMRLYELAEMHFAEVLTAMPNDPKAKLESLRLAGQRAANRGDMSVAADKFTQACELDPNDVMLWRLRAMSHLAIKNVDASREDCMEMVKRFGTTDDTAFATVMLYACTTPANALADPKVLLPAAEVARRGWHNGQRCYGAALYRNARYEEAARYFEKVEGVFQTTAWDMCFLAMAHYHLGHRDLAQRYLDRAKTYANEADRVDESQPGGSDTGDEVRWGTWDDRISAMAVLSEASQLIKP